MNTEAVKLNPAENKIASKWLPLGGLAVLLVLSEAVYLALLQLNAVNGWQPVLTFWLEMAALFVFYALAAVLVTRFQNIKKAALWLIFGGAILFRLTLLPAGIPHDLTASEKLAALRDDLRGTEVTYERYQLFDNDIWRYLWDSHVWAHGINPYQYPPSDARLDALAGETAENENFVDYETEDLSNETATSDESANETNEATNAAAVEETNQETKTFSANYVLPTADLTDGREIWGDIRDNVNYSDVTTVYPPLAQFVFWVSHRFAPGSLLMMKMLLVGCELLGILFLVLTLKRLELPVTRVILYAWNPLMIKVFAGSGHADAILVAALCATVYFVVRGSKSLAAVTFGLAILAKLSPVFLLPFFWRRVGWLRTLLVGAVVFGGYLPFLDAGENLFAGFLKFAREWQFNAGAFAFIRWIAGNFTADAGDLARKICAFFILTIIAWLVWRDDLKEKTFVKSAAIVLGALVIFSPTVMPWYLSWVLPLAVLARQNIWIYFSALVLTAFHIMIDLNEYAWALWFEHGLFFALVVSQLWFNRTEVENGLIFNKLPWRTA
jgi:alpha-1,6-mannosyltransferase